MRSTLKIEVYPKSKRRVYTSTSGALGSLDQNIYEQTIAIKIELPKMDSYPVFELSNTRADFKKAEEIFPVLAEHFKLLQKMRAISFKTGTNCRWFLNSMCVSHIKEKSYLDIIGIYPNNAVYEVIDFINSIGADSSCIQTNI